MLRINNLIAIKKSLITSFFWFCAITILQLPLFQSVNAQTLINPDMMETIWETPDSVISVPVIEVSSEIAVSSNVIKEIRKKLPDSSVIKSIEGQLESIDTSLRLLTEMHTLEEIELLSLEVKEQLDIFLAYETALGLQSTTVTAYLEQCGHSLEKSHKLTFLRTHPPVWV